MFCRIMKYSFFRVVICVENLCFLIVVLLHGIIFYKYILHEAENWDVIL
jgi:hypothetical protein